MSAHARRDSGTLHAAPGLHRQGPAPSHRRRWRAGVLVALTAAGLSGIGMGLGAPESPGRSPSTVVEQDDSAPGAASPGRHAQASSPVSEPVRLDVPEVGIHADLVNLGLKPDGTLEVPSAPMRAGWYTGSPTPGSPGPSVIVGHVDSAEGGPAVFYRLGELTPGSRIDATRKDGRVARFEVTVVRSYAKHRFPTQAVYGNTDGPTLRLITCGKWNRQTEEYDNNVVVFATLVELTPQL